VTRRRLRALALSLVAAFVLVAAGCGGGSSGATAGETTAGASSAVTLVSPADAQALIEGGDVEVVDVRTPAEFAEGHLDGATLVDFYEPDFADRIAELDRDREYVVYCRSGNRSSQATAMMAARGFTDVNDVDGGIVAWEAAGLPVVR
jgi:rhodanese-related sulfurtransferase